MNVIIKILKYLKVKEGNFSLWNENPEEPYTNIGNVGLIIDKRSTYRYCTYVWGNLVADGTNELIWLKILLEEL